MTGFQLFWVNRDGCQKCSRSGTPDFTPFGEFMILLIRYICIIVPDFTHSLYMHYISLNLSVLGPRLWINFFAWICLAALSPTYFIYRILFKMSYILAHQSLSVSNNDWVTHIPFSYILGCRFRNGQ